MVNNYYTTIHMYIIYSDEDDTDTLDWLPMAPEIEDPEEPGWGQLEVRLAGTQGVGNMHTLVDCHCSLTTLALVLCKQ